MTGKWCLLMIVSIVRSLLRILCTRDSAEVDDGWIRFRLEDGLLPREVGDLSVSLRVQHVPTYHYTNSHFAVTAISPLSSRNTFGSQ